MHPFYLSIYLLKLRGVIAKFESNVEKLYQEYEKHIRNLQSKVLASPISQTMVNTEGLQQSKGGTLHVYTDNPQVEEFLDRPEFVISMYCNYFQLCWDTLVCSSNVVIHFETKVLPKNQSQKG